MQGIDPRHDLEIANTKKEAAKMGNGLSRLLVSILLLLPLRALVASWFWLWFVVPTFPLAPALGVAQSYGILLTVNMFFTALPKRTDKDERTEAEKWTQTLIAFPGYLALWGIGWLFFKLVLN